MSTTATCDIRFSMQNRYADDDLAGALTNLGVSNRAVTISGRATKSDKEISKEEFLGAKAKAIRAKLSSFLDEHDLPQDHDLVILDMEPQCFAPRHLGDFEGAEQRDLIAAYRLRIRVARQELRRTGREGLRLGMYQVIVPDGRGRATDEFERRMAGYLEAGRQGMYDELDFICPVLYQRFRTRRRRTRDPPQVDRRLDPTGDRRIPGPDPQERYADPARPDRQLLDLQRRIRQQAASRLAREPGAPAGGRAAVRWSLRHRDVVGVADGTGDGGGQEARRTHRHQRVSDQPRLVALAGLRRNRTSPGPSRGERHNRR